MEKLKSISDEVLVASYINGSELSLEVLIIRHKSKIFSQIYRKVRSKALAEDLFQETFIKAVMGIKDGKYSEDGRFGAWVSRIANNLIIDHFRKEKKNKEFIPNFDITNSSYITHDIENSIEDFIITASTYNEMSKLVEMLPLSQKEVLKLRFYSNLSFKEIAEETNVSVNTALGRMRYAILNLKKLIIEKNIVISAPLLQ